MLDPDGSFFLLQKSAFETLPGQNFSSRSHWSRNGGPGWCWTQLVRLRSRNTGSKVSHAFLMPGEYQRLFARGADPDPVICKTIGSRSNYLTEVWIRFQLFCKGAGSGSGHFPEVRIRIRLFARGADPNPGICQRCGSGYLIGPDIRKSFDPDYVFWPDLDPQLWIRHIDQIYDIVLISTIFWTNIIIKSFYLEKEKWRIFYQVVSL